MGRFHRAAFKVLGSMADEFRCGKGSGFGASWLMDSGSMVGL